jgi:hypothetical protein
VLHLKGLGFRIGVAFEARWVVVGALAGIGKDETTQGLAVLWAKRGHGGS